MREQATAHRQAAKAHRTAADADREAGAALVASVAANQAAREAAKEAEDEQSHARHGRANRDDADAAEDEAKRTAEAAEAATERANDAEEAAWFLLSQADEATTKAPFDATAVNHAAAAWEADAPNTEGTQERAEAHVRAADAHRRAAEAAELLVLDQDEAIRDAWGVVNELVWSWLDFTRDEDQRGEQASDLLEWALGCDRPPEQTKERGPRGPVPTPDEVRKQAEEANRAVWEADALADLRSLPEPLLKSALAWLSDEALEADGRPRIEKGGGS